MEYSFYIYSSYFISIAFLVASVFGVLRAKKELLLKLRLNHEVNNSN